MSLKVSLDFLEGPVPKVMSKASKIAKNLEGNKYFPYPPITPGGLQAAVEELKQLQSKSKTKNGKEKCEVALADVTDFIRQTAEYVDHASKNSVEIMETSGFDPDKKTISKKVAVAV